jgi:carboxylesterase type B
MLQFTTDNSFRCGTVQEPSAYRRGEHRLRISVLATVHGQEALGALHASEIPFIFGTLPVWQNMRNTTIRSTYVADAGILTNFADCIPTAKSSSGQFDATARAI